MARKEKESRPKKSIFKRWWFWLLVAVVLIGAFGSGNKSGSGPAATTTPAATQPQEEQTTATEATAEPTAEPTEVPMDAPMEESRATPEPDISAHVTGLVDANLAADGSETVKSVDLTNGKLSIALSVSETDTGILSDTDYAADVVSRVGEKVLSDELLDDLWETLYIKVGDNGPDCYLGKKNIVKNEYGGRYFDPDAIMTSLLEGQ